MRRGRWLGLALVLGSALTAARAAAQQPATTTSERAALRAAEARAEPGDRIILKVYREEELSDSTILVNERGEATFPRIGVVPVSRFPIGVLRDSLRTRFARYLREPEIDVVVMRRVSVSGEVRRPDVYYVDVAATLRDVVARAGGLTPDGDPRRLTVQRDGRATRVGDWRDAQGSEYDLRSGDQVFVGTKPWLARNALGLASTAAIVVSVTFSIIQAR